jgi:hypothetical protein
LLEEKFGIDVLTHIKNMAAIPLKRQLLGN